jgi:hypothetical protein
MRKAARKAEQYVTKQRRGCSQRSGVGPGWLQLHRTYSIEFKRQVAQEYIAGETLHPLAR